MARARGFERTTVLGLALVALAAGVISGLSVEQQTYTVTEVKAHTSTPYDMLVLPQRAGAVIAGLADPNAIDEGAGGITLAQWKAIEALPSVAVAAPLAPLGATEIGFSSVAPWLAPEGSGLYRITARYSGQGLPGAPPEITYWLASGSGPWTWPPVWGSVMAIDPSAENEMVGLRGAVAHGSYFGPNTASSPQPGMLLNVPALVTSTPPTFGSASISVQSLPDPYSAARTLDDIVKEVRVPASPSPLAALQGPVVFQATVSDSDVWRAWIAEQEGKPGPYRVGGLTFANDAPQMVLPLVHIGPLTYSPVPSPYPGRWPLALQAHPVACRTTAIMSCVQFAALGEPFRTLAWPRRPMMSFHVVGVYSAAKLRIATDPLTGAPMVNYAPETGKVVLSPAGKAINPPLAARPDVQPAGLFTQPPIMLVPIRDVLPMLSKAPISSIRVRVKGARSFGMKVQRKLQAVASRIHEATGLRVEIIRGASPQEVLIHPGHETGYAKSGWIQETWVKTGAAIELLRQSLLSQDVILIPILVAAFVFALSAGITGVEVRRKDYATLLAIGVAPSTVRASVLRQGLLYGCAVAVLTLTTAVAIAGRAAVETGALVALLGGVLNSAALAPVARAVERMEPLPSLRESPPPMARGVAAGSTVGLGITLFLSSIRRHLSAISALLVPGAVFYLIFLVRSSLHHTMYLTGLGQYLLVHIDPLVTLGAGVVIVLAILTSAQLGLRNAALRATTWAIGQAVGWPMTVPVVGSLVEAGIVGLISGVVGATLGALVGDGLFGAAFQPALWAEAVLLIVLSGLVAAVPTAVAISKQEPAAHLRGVGP